jgi:hypothetical protein
MESTVKTVKQLRAEKELHELLESTADVCAGLNERRTRRKPKDPNAEYFEAVLAQQRDSGKRGGLVKGSGYHYERDF